MHAYRRAFALSIPVFFCYFPLGVIYGLLCTQAGYSWYAPTLISAFSLSAVMQFLALTMLPMSVSLLAFGLALIPLGIRNIFYGLTFLKRYEKAPFLLRLYLAHGLVDATYSILITEPEEQDKKQDLRFVTVLTLLIHSYWVLGTLCGTFVDRIVALPKGLEFSLTAFLAAAATENLRKRKEYTPILIAFGTGTIALWLVPQHFFLGAVSLSVLICLGWPTKMTKEHEEVVS